MNKSQEVLKSMGWGKVEPQLDDDSHLVGEASSEGKTLQTAMVKYFNSRLKEHPGNIASDFASAVGAGLQASKLDDKVKKVVKGNIENRFGG